MKTTNLYFFSLIISLIFLSSCKDDKYIAPDLGNATFSIALKARNNGRVTETAPPAFVLLSIKDSHDNVQENIKLPLFAFGEGYLSESLELQTGNYQLTQFVVLDATNKIIYATPLEGSDLAQYVSDPLPIEFTVTNEGTQVTPQVLAVQPEDNPALFGYASFGFEVIGVPILTIPLTGVEEVTKVSYQFSDGTQTISSEATPTGPVLTINYGAMLEGTWKTTVTVWTNSTSSGQNYQKAYRYEKALNFDGGIINLPSLVENDSWVLFYYSEHPEFHNIRILNSADPRKSYHVEIESPLEPSSIFGIVDRNYYTESGDALCDYTNRDILVTSFGKVDLPDQSCDLSSLGAINSSIILNEIKADGSLNLIIYSLNWVVQNGEIISFSISRI